MTPQPTQPGQEGQERVWVRAVDGRPDRLLPTLVLSSYCPGPPENWIEVIPRPDREALDERTPFDPGATQNEDGSWNLPDQQETDSE
jgi:hypothetical protein